MGDDSLASAGKPAGDDTVVFNRVGESVGNDKMIVD